MEHEIDQPKKALVVASICTTMPFNCYKRLKAGLRLFLAGLNKLVSVLNAQSRAGPENHACQK